MFFLFVLLCIFYVNVVLSTKVPELTSEGLKAAMEKEKKTAQERLKKEGTGYLGKHDKPIELNCETYADVRNKSTWLVEYYDPGCPYCRRLEKVYEQLAKKTHATLTPYPVYVARIACTVHPTCCQREGITAFPTFRMFRRGYLLDPALKEGLRLTSQQNLEALVSTYGTVDVAPADLIVALNQAPKNYLILSPLSIENGLAANVTGRQVLMLFTADWCRQCDSVHKALDQALASRKEWKVPKTLQVQAFYCGWVDCTQIPGFRPGMKFPQLVWVSEHEEQPSGHRLSIPLLSGSGKGGALLASDIREFVEDPHLIFTRIRPLDNQIGGFLMDWFQFAWTQIVLLVVLGALIGISLGRCCGCDRFLLPDDWDEPDHVRETNAKNRPVDPAVEAELRALARPSTWRDYLGPVAMVLVIAWTTFFPHHLNTFFIMVGLKPDPNAGFEDL